MILRSRPTAVVSRSGWQGITACASSTARTGKELLADRDYGDGVYGLAFAPDGA